VVPGADDSGGRHRHKTSRDGNRYLKLAFSHAAIRAVQYFPEVRQWFQRWKRKKPIRVARALVAKELAKSVYMVLHEGVEFDQQFKGDAADETEAGVVAPPGKPLRLTELSGARRIDWEVRRHAEVGIWDARGIARSPTSTFGQLSP